MPSQRSETAPLETAERTVYGGSAITNDRGIQGGRGLNLGARISRWLVESEDIETGIARALEGVGKHFEIDFGFLMLFDDRERIIAQWGWTRVPPEPPRLPLGTTLVQLSGASCGFLRIGQTVGMTDRHKADLSGREQENLDKSGGFSANLMVPVLTGTELTGVLGFFMFQPREWAEDTIAEVENVAQVMLRIVARTGARQVLAIATARAHRIAAYIPDGIVMLSEEGQINWVSPSLSDKVGSDVSDLENTCVSGLIYPDDRQAVGRAVADIRGEPEATVTARVKAGDSWRWADLSLRLAVDPDGAVPDEVVVLVRDTHDRHLRELALAEESSRDPLTGLANRAGFERWIQDIEAREDDVLVAFCDIDDFKDFNDLLGHDAGDAVLGLVGEAIRSAVRSQDVAARIGGDEFALVMLDARQDASSLGSRLVNAVRLIEFDGPKSPTVSVGVRGPG
ncbi:MAG: diguanylate cyclase domain-containing protein, partial [Acidimicrobiales bacterium]